MECAQEGCLISQVMRRRECEQGESAPDQVEARMARALEIMREYGIDCGEYC